MLVLTRRANESIMIGDDIVITVLDVRGDQIRIGIKAPRSVAVHREEVYAELQAANQAAAAQSSQTSRGRPLPPNQPRPAAGERRTSGVRTGGQICNFLCEEAQRRTRGLRAVLPEVTLLTRMFSDYKNCHPF